MAAEETSAACVRSFQDFVTYDLLVRVSRRKIQSAEL
jgi:hypothetical protein